MEKIGILKSDNTPKFVVQSESDGSVWIIGVEHSEVVQGRLSKALRHGKVISGSMSYL
jgi:hypothetical protein